MTSRSRGRGSLIALFLVAVIAGHIATVLGAPYVLAGAVIWKVSQGGAASNRFTFMPRTTEASRGVVRPSPDLAYAICPFDLSRGPIHVRAAPWGDYMSISVFQANGDNVYAVNDREAPRGVDFILATGEQAASVQGRPGMPVVMSPSARGLILDRRLAPTAQAFALADRARRADSCSAVGS